MVQEARLEAVGSGWALLSEGWFVVNVRDAAWLRNDNLGACCVFGYPRSELALRRGADVEAETRSPAEACASCPYWRPDRPGGWNDLPWA
jgi:hypothetical protein